MVSRLKYEREERGGSSESKLYHLLIGSISRSYRNYPNRKCLEKNLPMRKSSGARGMYHWKAVAERNSEELEGESTTMSSRDLVQTNPQKL